MAMRLNSYGNEVHLISAVGADDYGDRLLAHLQAHGMDTSGIQRSADLPTGLVQVTLNSRGSASYEIKFPSAWDNIEANEEMLRMAEASDAFVFGSLVARSEVSRKSLLELLSVARHKFFDLNLRAPHYTKPLLLELMQQADFIKFNDDELYEVAEMFGSRYRSLEQNIGFMSDLTDTRDICVTKGSHGAVLYQSGNLHYNSGYLIQVRDTVGAGDSFLASLIDQLLHGEDPQHAVDFACAVGAMVAESEGANPNISLDQIKAFINPYKGNS